MPVLKSPLLSIAVTTYDRRELLIETIRSILDQSITDIEIIVGNDNTSRRVDEEYTGIKDPRIRYINNEHNLGEWANLKHLFNISTGYYFTSLADDDLYKENFLKETHEIINKYNFPECIYTSFTEIKADFDQVLPKDIVEGEMSGKAFMEKYIKHELKAMGNCGIFKRETLKKLGGVVDWDTKSYADTWMTFYLAANIDRIIYINKPMIYFRDHEGSLSSNLLSIKEWMRSQQELIEKMVKLLNAKFPEKQEEYLFYILNFWCIGSFYSRMLKINNINFSLMYEYYLMISKYFHLLGGYRRKIKRELLKKIILFLPVRLIHS
jgi:glycosyltransferase involved in cell wall biosynthesis